ncbi:UPF0197 transmembrane protein [Cavenderia fasciculata]|uniref:Dolichyl-diphosphooligosaccharide-protein glycosyltransferase subunit OST5 n=1 Tax=Cavenderia fasciculata TaxID=261658 RepID=F4QCL6_CACFS|nr:UPF0197 transmembrane protein [Cavenderia fasciculata]EGG14444.1 UPF0197 transmembrane protein [Cavenderia fasciculata]|eukprot:XP_004353853.1 UPF0197 transmembrane protein [Cavenderia fasciculata]
MALVAYESLIDPSAYPFFAFLFVVIGLFAFSTFAVSELTSTKKNIFKGLTLATIASATLGLGIFFVFLAGGIYV